MRALPLKTVSFCLVLHRRRHHAVLRSQQTELTAPEPSA